ncbi:ABC transporter substrate-binding protein [Oceanobacillus halophilus]|nr:ABC transporter substrate-binding protein [Oceanobacillus halophilus]
MNCKFKSKILLYFFLLLLVVLAGCKESEQPSQNEDSLGSEGDTLRVAISGEAEKLDPHFASPVNEVAIVQTIFNGLVKFPSGTVDFSKIEGDLAQDWEHNEDATKWTFFLKEGVQWQKGYGELTSSDVKKSFERVMDEETGSPWKNDYNNIASIETPDDYTVEFNLTQPDTSFLLKVINYHGGMIVNTEAIKDAGDSFMTSPVGTGPFIFEEYNSNEKVVLVKNEDYFKGEPRLNNIEFMIMTDTTAIEIAMDQGEIHLAPGINDQLWVDKRNQNNDLTIDYTNPPLLWGIYLNTSKAPLDDIKVRKAIAHAIDIEPLIEEISAKEAASVPEGPVTTGYFGAANVGSYEYDVEKTKDLLKEAGYEDGLTLPTQYISTLSSYLDKMVFVQDQLKKAGIDMPLEQVDHSTYHANARDDLNNIVMYGYVRAPHANVTLSQFFYGPATVGTPTAVTNYSHYDKVDDLIEQGSVEVDEKKAIEIYKKAQEQIKEDYVFVPLVELKTVLIRRNEVNLGYNNNDIDGTMIYYYNIDENTEITK